jgi:hypothetical protein
MAVRSAWPRRAFCSGIYFALLVRRVPKSCAVEFATVTGVYFASLFIAFQIVNYLFFRHTPSPGVLVGGTAIIYFWK